MPRGLHNTTALLLNSVFIHPAEAETSFAHLWITLYLLLPICRLGHNSLHLWSGVFVSVLPYIVSFCL